MKRARGVFDYDKALENLATARCVKQKSGAAGSPYYREAA
jgi:hypothetical protein